MLKILMVIILAYFIGNFSPAYVLGKTMEGKDIREFGSKSAGSTNALRVFGKKVALLTFALDILKGFIAVWIGRYLEPEMGAYLAGLFVIIGHNWPIILGFKGGKGIASTLGVMLGLNPLLALISTAVAFALIFKTRYVSVGSIVGITLFPILVILFNRPFDKDLVALAIILAIIGIYQHRANLIRLKNGNENKISMHKK